MAETITPPSNVTNFVERWASSGAAERANYQIFLAELCDVLAVPRPEPTRSDEDENAYVFEKAVTFQNGDGSTSAGRIDLYKRGVFVLEAKQGSEQGGGRPPSELLPTHGRARRRGTAVRGTQGWDEAMLAARGQAEQYARALPAAEGRPPFVIVVDVGHSISLYAEFSRSGGAYVPFPDSVKFRIPLRDLEREEVRELLRTVWTDPLALDPSTRSTRITRDIAGRLARLAKSLEASGHGPERVAAFLMRAIFTMFAEDVRLIPQGGFAGLLESLRGQVSIFPDMVESVWRAMGEGGFSPTLRRKLLRFNGGLFESAEALPVTDEQLELLIEASRADWRDVEPAIFGTLLEQALDPVERHRLGAHYTPRAYVERLVMPTVIEPLRGDWEAARAAAVTLAKQGDLRGAAAEIRSFHERLCQTRVLDPACGTGNFLYVTLEHMKRLEGEVLNALADFGEQQTVLLTVDPHQLLGLEVNPRAAAIADLVLWIGYLQWHFRTRGEALPQEPVLKKFSNIENRDAVLAYDAVEVVTSDSGAPVTRWDGRTTKKHPVTGEDVPDETARVMEFRYMNSRRAEWQAADFIVGNPPFIGNKRMRAALGDGYVQALRQTHKGVSETVDYVMYWWNQAAEILRAGKIRKFGFVTTNSISQPFNRKVIQEHLEANDPLSLTFAIPDHPWLSSADGAAVRIAITVAEARERTGTLSKVVQEETGYGDGAQVNFTVSQGRINPDLSIGVDISSAVQLKANSNLAIQGLNPLGLGFRLSPEEVTRLGYDLNNLPRTIRPYLIGRDLVQIPETKYVIDFFGLSEAEARQQYPVLYQHVLTYVKPERDQNRRGTRRLNWWIFGENAPALRRAVAGIPRYIATCRTAKHRTFTLIPSTYLADAKIVGVGLDEAYHLGVLSSRVHVAFAIRTGAWLGVGNDSNYNHADCFNKFPFPNCTEEQKLRVRALAESLDAHRKRQQARHPRLTVTDMYNVLGSLRAGEPLNERERVIHEQGIVTVLGELHDDLDKAVCDAYGFAHDIADDKILERLVALNHERAAEEKRGLVRWLRPEYQHPQGVTQSALDMKDEAGEQAGAKAGAKPPFPTTLAEQARAVRNALAAHAGVATPSQLAKTFRRARVERIDELLQTLVLLGQARRVEEGKYAV